MLSDLPNFSVSVIPLILLVFPYTILYGCKRMLWWICFPDCHCCTQVRECVGNLTLRALILRCDVCLLFAQCA
jgi:hypothetical protein